MLKTIIFLIAGSVIVYGMSIQIFFTAVFHSINYIYIDSTEVLRALLDLVNLQTAVPNIGFNITNLRDLLIIIEEANFIYELGYTHVNGVLVYAIQIGGEIYSVEPQIFHDLIYIISYHLMPNM
jgi:hypothetical protein